MESSWWLGSESMEADKKEMIVEELMKTYGSELTNLAYTYVKDWHRAEEVAQDVFIKCFLKIDTFRGDASIKTWLYRITINRCKDILRTWSFRNIKPRPLDLNLISEGTSVSAEHEVFRQREQAQMIKTVFTLPVKYREVIFLHYYSDQSINEMSELIGKNPKTIRTRLRRAKLMLEKILKEENENGR